MTKNQGKGGHPGKTPKRWHSRRQGGFTMIEILLALSIFSASFLALAAGATTVMKSNKTSYMSTIATNLAQDKLEELMATSASSIDGGGPVVSIVDGVVFTREWSINDAAIPGLRQIDVVITWNDITEHNLTVRSAVDL